ncbi:hypothetical protein cypCar_00044577, partial [Cyprinus carpio]
MRGDSAQTPILHFKGVISMLLYNVSCSGRFLTENHRAAGSLISEELHSGYEDADELLSAKEFNTAYYDDVTNGSGLKEEMVKEITPGYYDDVITDGLKPNQDTPESYDDVMTSGHNSDIKKVDAPENYDDVIINRPSSQGVTQDAEVVCRELDCGAPVQVLGAAAFGKGDAQMWKQEIQCGGDEYQFALCSTSPSQFCSHENDVSVACAGRSWVPSGWVVLGRTVAGEAEFFNSGSWEQCVMILRILKDAHVWCADSCSVEWPSSEPADVINLRGGETRESSQSRLTCFYLTISLPGGRVQGVSSLKNCILGMKMLMSFSQ